MSSEDHELWLIGYLLFLSELEINILSFKGSRGSLKIWINCQVREKIYTE